MPTTAISLTIFLGNDIDVGPNPVGLMRITRIIINTIRAIRFLSEMSIKNLLGSTPRSFPKIKL